MKHLLLIPFVALSVACTELGDSMFTAPPPAPDASPTAPDAAPIPPTLDALHDQVFGGCSCHLTSAPAGDLDLSRDLIHAELVDRAASCDSALTLVVPGDPEASLLVDKLAARTEGGEPACGSGMPQFGNPIDQEELDAIRAWILAGAQE